VWTIFSFRLLFELDFLIRFCNFRRSLVELGREEELDRGNEGQLGGVGVGRGELGGAGRGWGVGHREKGGGVRQG
jgi:hypothetical protein